MADTSPTLFESFQYEGYWWLPEDPDNKVAGVLSFDPGSGIELRLLGAFQDLEQLGEDHAPEIILGHIITPSRPATLVHCSRTGYQRSIPGYLTAKYRADFLLLGEHFDSPEAIRFHSISAQYTNFERWMEVLPFQTSPRSELDEQGRLVRLEVDGKYEAPEFVKVALDSIESAISFSSSLDVSPGDYTELSWKHKISVVLESHSDQPLIWALERSASIHNLLAVLIGEPVYTKVLRGYGEEIEHENGSRSRPQVDVFYAFPHPGSLEKIHPHYMMVTAKRLGDEMVCTVFQSWFEREEFIKPLTDLFLGIEYNSSMFLESKFLTLTQALERYHRKRIGSRFSQRKRLEDLIGRLPEHLRELVTDNVKAFVDSIVDTRNYYTHYDESLRDRALTDRDLYLAVLQLGVLISILVFRELQIPDDLVREAHQRSKKYRILRQNPPGI